jgi:chemosensory pili system protein ChpA (sensor histidine kinase/response regulator)
MGSQFDDSSIKSFFVIEAQEYIESYRKYLARLYSEPQNLQPLEEIKKTAHTLKGSAAMLGFDEISHLSRYMEEFMKGLAINAITYSDNLRTILSHLVELTSIMVANISGEKEDSNDLIYASNSAIFEKALKNYRKIAGSKTDGEKPVDDIEVIEKEINRDAELDDAFRGLQESPSFDIKAELPPGEEPASAGNIVPSEQTVSPVQYQTDVTIPKAGEPSIPEYHDPAPGAREPRKTDFFLPTAPSTRLQSEKKEKHGLSFLEMIPDIKESFILEATDHIQTLDHLLLDWESDHKNQDLAFQIMRAAHSLKGSANMVGFSDLGSIAHRMEDIIEKVREGGFEINIKLIDLLFEGLDTMKVLIKGLDEGIEESVAVTETIIAKLDAFILGGYKETAQEIPAAEKSITSEMEAIAIEQESEVQPIEKPVASEKHALEAEIQVVTEEPVASFQPKKTYTTGPLPVLEEDDLSRAASTLSTRIPMGETEKQIVRVHINQLDQLMNLVGELVINRAKIDRRVDFFKHIGDELDFSRRRLTQSIREFSDQYEFTLPGQTSQATGQGLDEFSALEFDKYDDFNILSRSLMEIGSDVVEIINEMKEFLGSFDKEIQDIAGIISHLQEEITRARMVPIGRLFRRFTRTVRDIANRDNKNIQLMILGEETDLDKTVIEEMADPLMHLVRNAVSHGIEIPQERALLGKNRQGTILLNAYPKGNQIILEVEDDGRGLDLDKIKQKAIDMGLLTEEAAETVSQSVIIDYIFTPGFSTSAMTTEISGRGVGLDVVRQNILHLGGSISVQTEKNIGTRFIIKLPLTLAITRALFVSVSGYRFALPLNAVEETIVLDTKKIANLANQEIIEIRERKIPLLKLNDLLQLPTSPDGKRFVPVVILSSAETSAALMVDELLGQEEIVVKRFGAYLENLMYFSGATISGDGKVILILDPTHLVGFEEFSISATGTMESTLRERIGLEEPQVEVEKEKKGKLLLVDDSISIRKFVGKLLENAGYDVDVAIDGLEALTKVGGTRYSIIITDLEMPRMHGYEFITEIKNDDRFKMIPIIVLTSRAGEKHKRKAMSIGADGYIVKPFNEETLLENISRLL